MVQRLNRIEVVRFEFPLVVQRKLAATLHAPCRVTEPKFSRAMTSVRVHQAFSALKRTHRRPPGFE